MSAIPAIMMMLNSPKIDVSSGGYNATIQDYQDALMSSNDTITFLITVCLVLGVLLGVFIALYIIEKSKGKYSYYFPAGNGGKK